MGGHYLKLPGVVYNRIVPAGGSPWVAGMVELELAEAAAFCLSNVQSKV